MKIQFCINHLAASGEEAPGIAVYIDMAAASLVQVADLWEVGVLTDQQSLHVDFCNKAQIGSIAIRNFISALQQTLMSLVVSN